MTPTLQTEEHTCLQACLASLLDVPITTVPSIHANCTDWLQSMNLWLIQHHNTYLVRLRQCYNPPTCAYYIGIGPSPRGNWNHAVVMRLGTVRWDPAGEGAEPIQEVRTCLVLHTDLSLQPTRVVN